MRAPGQQALQIAKQSSLTITGAVVHNHRVGGFLYYDAYFPTANVDTTFSDLALDRTPNGFIPFGSVHTGVVVIGSLHKADWAPGVIVLQATTTGHYQLLIG